MVMVEIDEEGREREREKWEDGGSLSYSSSNDEAAGLGIASTEYICSIYPPALSLFPIE